MDQNQEKPQPKPTSLETDGSAARPNTNNWAANAAQDVWRHPQATAEELKFMSIRGGVSEQAEADAIKAQIATHAEDPESALTRAVKNNRVVGFADMHVRQGPYFQFLIDEMPKLKAAGITDVAVEIPKIWQHDVDNLTKTRQNDMSKQLTDGQSLLDVVDAAKKAGLRVTAVDEYYKGSGDNLYSRDKTMTQNIEQILKDEDKKVLYFVGAEHLSSGMRRASSTPTTAQRLRNDNYSVETFYQQIPSFPDGMGKSASDLNRPVSVFTRDANLLATVQTAGVMHPPYGNFDNVIFYPPHYKMDHCETELNQFGEQPVDALKADLQQNRVLLLGEMKRFDPVNPDSEHRKLFSQTIPELAKSGLTDFALNIPVSNQKDLDEYAKNGLPSGPLNLPDPYGGLGNENFKPVLDAAIKSGLKLHAIGPDIHVDTQMKDVIDALSKNLEQISQNNNGGKTLMWSEELFVAKFFKGEQEISVAQNLKDAGLPTTAIADFSQDFDKFSPGVVTQLITNPVLVKPDQTQALKTIMNNQRMQMDRFDQVIVYPSE